MRLATTAIAFMLLASVALAGPNADGVLVLHDPGIAYTSDANYIGLSGVACGQDGPPDQPYSPVCPPYDPSSGPNPCDPRAADPTSHISWPDGAKHVWYVMAAFPEGSCPRLHYVGFRIRYDASKVYVDAAKSRDAYDASVVPAPQRVVSDQDGTTPFPGPDTGVGMAFTSARTSQLQELWWFVGYSYPGAVDATFSVSVLSGLAGDNSNFGDDAIPTNLDPIAGFGRLGLGGAVGENPTPGPPQPEGACCDTYYGTCSVTTAASCVAPTHTWHQAFTCETYQCPPPGPTGACCTDTGSCVIMYAPLCSLSGGYPVGAGVPCNPDPCALMPGACCDSTSCWVTTPSACGPGVGSWMGPFTTCSPSPCATIGACCNLQDGACEILSETECAQETYPHAYSGGGTTCNPNPCPVPTGACCSVDGTCQVLTNPACAEIDGTYQGGATTCSPNPCPQPSGACCITDVCTFIAQAACAGQWLGAFAPCDPNPCTALMGACCNSTACTLTQSASCQGQWRGAGTVCTPNPCGPTGACCFTGGTCMVRTWAQCAYESAQMYMGNGTVCEPNPCPTSGVGDAGLAMITTLRAAPNPFTGSTTLRLSGPPAISARVLVFDAAGRLVRTAWEGSLDGREVTIIWDGKDQSGRETPAGIYLLRVESTAGEAIGRLVKTR